MAPMVVWITGHTAPYADAADHEVMAPYTPGCGHGPAFAVDSVQTLPDWIAALLPALLASLAPHTVLVAQQLYLAPGQFAATHSPQWLPSNTAAPGLTTTGRAG
jgi:hypothetical protein